MGGGDLKLLTVAFLWVGMSCAMWFALLMTLGLVSDSRQYAIEHGHTSIGYFAALATLAGADLLIILTQVDGLLDENGQVIPLVGDIDRVKKLANHGKGRFSVGGMITKLEAVKMAVDAGITTVIINGRRPDGIAAVIAGEETGTRFIAKRRPLRPTNRR
jgi:isopentenyl phosphate kinase